MNGLRILARRTNPVAVATCATFAGLSAHDSSRCDGWKFWQKKAAPDAAAAPPVSGGCPMGHGAPKAVASSLSGAWGPPATEPKTGVEFPSASGDGSLRFVPFAGVPGRRKTTRVA